MPASYPVPVGLRRSWVDRARVMTREATGAKVRGTTTYATVAGPWFPCRLLITDAAAEDQEDGRVRVVQGPQISYSLVAEDGSDVELSADDVIEVESNQEGFGTWRLAGRPMPIRKLRDLLGGAIVGVQRVTEP